MDLKQDSSSHLMISFFETPPNFISKFLSNVTNKTNLKYPANKFLAYHEGKQSILCVTFGDSIISNSEAVLSEAVLSETDTSQCSRPKIVGHVINLGKKGYLKVQVKTVDSDVVILCLTYADVAMSNLIESFLVAFGPKNNKIGIVDNFDKFSVSVCKILACFNGFTG